MSITLETTSRIRSDVAADPPRSAPPTRLRRVSARRRREWGLFALLALPNLVLLAVFCYWPVIANLYLSFTSWDMVAPQPLFIGLQNYITLFTGDQFPRVLSITLVWVVVAVVANLGIGLALASLFATGTRGSGAVSMLAFSPHVLSGAAVAAVWLFIFDPRYGLSRLAFEAIGLTSPAWTTTSQWALPAVLIVSIWQSVGFAAIVYLAAMQGLPQEVQEAARLDGANPWQVFWHVKLPLLSPTTFFLLVTTIIGAFQAFDTIAMITGGGPAGATTTLSWFIYEQGFKRFNVGFSAAGSVVMFIVLMLVTWMQFRFVEKRVHY